MKKALVTISIFFILIILLGGAECTTSTTPETGTDSAVGSARLVLFEDVEGFLSLLVPQEVGLTPEVTQWGANSIFHRLISPDRLYMVDVSYLDTMIEPVGEEAASPNGVPAYIFNFPFSEKTRKNTNLKAPNECDLLDYTDYHGGSYCIQENYFDPELPHPVTLGIFRKEMLPQQWISIGVILNEEITKEVFLQIADSVKLLRVFGSK